MLVLASGSPRRREILSEAGYQFRIITSEIDECISGLSPEETVRTLALRKALAVKDKCDFSDTILAADTLVFYGCDVLGKPRDRADAFRMLSMLSGSTHRVITGVCVLSGEREIVDSVETKVHFRILSENEINSYIDEANPLDKAGAYGIQETGDSFVRSIDGDYNNVVGLPLYRVKEILDTL